MIPPIHREPERDPRLAAALHGLAQASSDGDEPLVARIVEAARPRLGELRRTPRPWWAWTASWARVAVPVGVAASLAAGVLLMRDAGAGAVDDDVTESALVLESGDGPGGGNLAGSLLPQATDEWLLAAVLEP
jgi:hypothetical protein